MGGMAGLATLGSFAAACDGQAGTSGARPGGSSGGTGAGATAGGVAPAVVKSTGSTVDAELISQRYGGLAPFAPAPALPAAKPISLDAADPTVFSNVPIADKVTFVTIDDGIDKDPAFIQMVKDFQIPITISLADTLIKDDYAYFEKLYQTGYVSIQNHTVTHPLNMPGLSAQQQLDEISGQQVKLLAEYGVTPYIFRPPGGNYTKTTVSAVQKAGLGGVMLWKESMEINNMEYQTSKKSLDPGDIILCHFRGPAQLQGETMVQMMTKLYRHIQEQGYTVGDITKYV